jgi:hypothetical protein
LSKVQRAQTQAASGGGLGDVAMTDKGGGGGDEGGGDWHASQRARPRPRAGLANVQTSQVHAERAPAKASASLKWPPKLPEPKSPKAESRLARLVAPPASPEPLPPPPPMGLTGRTACPALARTRARKVMRTGRPRWGKRRTASA